MVDYWLPQAERKPINGRPGRLIASTRSELLALPWKILLHTTEGPSIQAAEVAYKAFPPQLAVDYRARRIVQHIPLNRSGYALRSSSSEQGPVIQIEIVGYAAQAATWPTGMLDWLADNVLGPIRQICPYGLTAPTFEGSAATAYGLSAKSRFTRTGWDRYSGIVGHQHSPGDSHWDPGAVNVTHILQRIALNPGQTASTTPPSGATEIMSLFADIVTAYDLHPTQGRTPSVAEVQSWGEQLLPKNEAERFRTLCWISETVATENRPPRQIPAANQASSADPLRAALAAATAALQTTPT